MLTSVVPSSDGTADNVSTGLSAAGQPCLRSATTLPGTSSTTSYSVTVGAAPATPITTRHLVAGGTSKSKANRSGRSNHASGPLTSGHTLPTGAPTGTDRSSLTNEPRATLRPSSDGMRLAEPVAEIAIEPQRLLVAGRRGWQVPGSLVQGSERAQRVAFAEPVADLAIEPQCLLVVGGRIGVGARDPVQGAERVERVGFAEPVAEVAVELQRLLVTCRGGGEVPGDSVHHAEAIQG